MINISKTDKTYVVKDIQEYKRLKREFRSKIFRDKMKIECGEICVNCKTPNNITYHHIVPLVVGGTNNFTNIVPLCYCCHDSVHKCKNMHDYIKEHGKEINLGARPRKICNMENYKDILCDYLHCKIDKTECENMLGYENSSSKINDAVWFKEYIKELHIKKYRNNILIIKKNSKLETGKLIGYIEYLDGHVEKFYYEQVS